MPIRLPRPSPTATTAEVETPARLVLIGANGSGKTRLGIWLEENNQDQMPVHRIGAQKALSIPEYAPVTNLEQAQKDLYLGRSDHHATLARKNQDRWGGSPATHLLSDYEKVLAVLFAKEADRDRQHVSQTRLAQAYVPVDESPIDQIVRLWAYLMPHRNISMHDGKVLVGKGSDNEYHAKEMSDGERVTLYLLAQCLTAPAGSMIIIDEPELHLHRSLMDKLWNKVEELCPTNTLVYITHDLDFAASRVGARKLWIQAYSKGEWTWIDVPADDDLPEALVLELIGNRKPVLFCEGERGGLDHTIYQACFPEHHVVPRGGGDEVIQAARALRANPAFHNVSAVGIVDRDVRSATEASELSAQGVEVLAFAEVENLLCVDELVELVAKKLSLDPVSVQACVTEFSAKALNDEIDTQVALRARRRIRYHLSRYSPTTNDLEGLQRGVDGLMAALDVEGVIRDSREAIDRALASGRLNDVLTVFNRKSLVDQISSCFGLKNREYSALVLRMLNSPDGKAVVAALRKQLPQF
ncbi:MAG: AAA family ATPase [Gemmatimonadota bacterium]